MSRSYFAPKTALDVLLSGGAAPPDNPEYWINFRATAAGPAGFVGDGPNSSYSLGGVYPERTLGAFTFGWVASGMSPFEYTTFAAYEHQAGRAGMTAGIDAHTFRINGFEIGQTYRWRASQGAISATVTSGFRIFSDNRVTQLHATPNVSVPQNDVADILAAVFVDPPAWTAGQGYVDIVATTANAYIAKPVANNGYLSAVSWKKIS